MYLVFQHYKHFLSQDVHKEDRKLPSSLSFSALSSKDKPPKNSGRSFKVTELLLPGVSEGKKKEKKREKLVVQMLFSSALSQHKTEVFYCCEVLRISLPLLQMLPQRRKLSDSCSIPCGNQFRDQSLVSPNPKM